MSQTFATSVIPPMSLTPKDEFLLIPRKITLQDRPKPYEFSDAALANLERSFRALKRPLAIDYEHQMIGTMIPQFARPDGLAPASGWVGDVDIRPDGLWVKNVKWTPTAGKMIADGEYKFFSPVIFWPKDKEWKSDSIVLGPIALTNDPDINGLQAVAARCSHAQSAPEKESEMDYKSLFAGALGLPPDAPDDQVSTALKSHLGMQPTASDDETATAWKAWHKNASVMMGVPVRAPTACKAYAEVEAEVTSLKAQLATATETSITAAKATHAGEITALKAQHTTEVSALKSQISAKDDVLATLVVDTLEQLGKIAPADKPELLTLAKANPQLILTVHKRIPVGAVVPVGKLPIASGASTVTASKHDAVTGTAAMANANPDRMALHQKAVAYADAHKVSYEAAVEAVSAT